MNFLFCYNLGLFWGQLSSCFSENCLRLKLMWVAEFRVCFVSLSAAISSRKLISYASHCFEGHLNNVSEPCFLREPPSWKLNDDYSTGGSWLLCCRVVSFDLFILSEEVVCLSFALVAAKRTRYPPYNCFPCRDFIGFLLLCLWIGVCILSSFTLVAV